MKRAPTHSTDPAWMFSMTSKLSYLPKLVSTPREDTLDKLHTGPACVLFARSFPGCRPYFIRPHACELPSRPSADTSRSSGLLLLPCSAGLGPARRFCGELPPWVRAGPACT